MADPSPVFYGRRKGRRLRSHKANLVETLLPQLLINKEKPIDLQALFPKASRYYLEIGFGGGEHLAHQASTNPDTGLIGCEPFVNGVASALEHIEKNGLTNIRLYHDDARHILGHLPATSFDKCFVLFPDPWPKKRHVDRRFINASTLEAIARIMQKGGELRLASDDPDMQVWFIEQLAACPLFSPLQGTDNGAWPEKPAGWMATRYEKKNLAKKRAGWVGPRYYSFCKA